MADPITKQQLIDASQDAETLEQVVNGNNTSNVTSREGRIYPTIAKALYEVIQTGGFESFLTQSALLASVPTVPKKAAKALDTKKIWYWGGSSWTDTGLSELDQAKDFANANPLFNPVTLTTSSDLNNYTSNGLFYAATTNITALERNFPTTMGGVLLVIKASPSISYQTYSTLDTISFRRISAGVWTTWVTHDISAVQNAASNYTDSKIGSSAGYDQSNLLSGATIIADKYLNTSGAVTNLTATMYAVIPVVAGSYFFKNYGANIVASSFPVGFSATANATTYTILTRNFVDTGVYRVDVTDTGYLAFDLKLNLYNFISTLHVTNSISTITKNAIKLNGADIADTKLRQTAFTSDNTESIGNLYNPAINKVDVYANIGSAAIQAASGAILAQIKLKKGATYHIKAPDLRSNIFCVALRDNPSMEIGSTLGLVTLNQITPTYKTFSIPIDSPAEYALFTVKLPSLTFDISSSIKITTYPTANTSKFANKLNGQSIAASTLNKLTGKRWIAVGDSMTEKNFRANYNYHDYIASDVGGMTVYNKGISGSGFHNRMNVADTLTEDADIITILLGTNDWGLVNNTYPLGTFISSDTETISGRINTCLSSLITKYPTAKIAIISAIPRLTNYGSNASPNSVGYTLKQHVDLLKQYAAHYSLPFLNLYDACNLPVWIPAANEYYFTAPTLTTPDGLHPNDAGQRVMADKIKAFLESI